MRTLYCTLFSGFSSHLYRREAPRQFLAYPTLGIKLCFSLMHDFSLAPTFRLHRLCFIVLASSSLLYHSCSFHVDFPLALWFFLFLLSFILVLLCSSFCFASAVPPHRYRPLSHAHCSVLYLFNSPLLLRSVASFFLLFLFLSLPPSLVVPLRFLVLKPSCHTQRYLRSQSVPPNTAPVWASPSARGRA